ncbi:hypothetical protein Shyhy02_69210 [Streptomyces hygroscopicus subsp. hygroscopicus]|nr:hypothetical protein Shyhy02_69210 [Streptomyces hygroscopicus subsp. hygroscopicus]
MHRTVTRFGAGFGATAELAEQFVTDGLQDRGRHAASTGTEQLVRKGGQDGTDWIRGGGCALAGIALIPGARVVDARPAAVFVLALSSLDASDGLGGGRAGREWGRAGAAAAPAGAADAALGPETGRGR